MNPSADLSVREFEVLELIAWGAAVKQVGYILGIDYKTADNHIQSIKEKTGCHKAAELSAWYFCHRFKISLNLSPLRKTIISCTLICLFTFGEAYHTIESFRCRTITECRVRTRNNMRCRTRFRTDNAND